MSSRGARTPACRVPTHGDAWFAVGQTCRQECRHGTLRACATGGVKIALCRVRSSSGPLLCNGLGFFSFLRRHCTRLPTCRCRCGSKLRTVVVLWFAPAGGLTTSRLPANSACLHGWRCAWLGGIPAVDGLFRTVFPGTPTISAATIRPDGAPVLRSTAGCDSRGSIRASIWCSTARKPNWSTISKWRRAGRRIGLSSSLTARKACASALPAS